MTWGEHQLLYALWVAPVLALLVFAATRSRSRALARLGHALRQLPHHRSIRLSIAAVRGAVPSSSIADVKMAQPVR